MGTSFPRITLSSRALTYSALLNSANSFSTGSITSAIQLARSVGGFSLLLDVEVQSEAEADEAIGAGADVIMLDNIDGPELQDVARRLKKRWSGKRKFLLESSGNITESNLNYRAVEGAWVLPLILQLHLWWRA